MNNRKNNTLKALLKGINCELVSLNNSEIVIRNKNGERKINVPFENINLNDKCSATLSIYNDNSLLLNLKSTSNDDIKSMTYRSTNLDDTFVFELLDESATYEICIGNDYEKHMNFIAINRKELIETEKDELDISYSIAKSERQVIASKNGNRVIVSENNLNKTISYLDKTQILETSDDITFIVKALLASNEEALMKTFKKLNCLGPDTSDILISKYPAVYEFQKLLYEAKEDKAVSEYLAIKASKAVKENILSK